MKRKGKLFVLVAGVLLLAGGGAYVTSKRGPTAMEVKIEEVVKRDLTASVTASGQVRPRTKVSLSADITGRIVRLSVKEGDMVSKGQFLLQIDPAQYEAAVQRAEAALASARAQATQTEENAKQASRMLARYEEMRSRDVNSVTLVELEQYRTQVKVTTAVAEASRHSVDQASAGLRDAKSNLTKTTITAPMGGRVTRLNIEEGETAIMGTLNRDAATLLTISDMGVLETQVRVNETDVARIKIGDSAVVQIDAFRDTTFVGRVVQIGNSSLRGAAAAPGQDQAVDFQVTLQLLDPPADTRPDFSALAKIITDRRHQVLSIPIIALTVRERVVPSVDESPGSAGSPQGGREVGQRDVEGVFVVGDDNKVAFRPVRVGIAGDKHFEVLSGLAEGERIVAGTYTAIRALRDSMVVRQTAAGDTTKSTGR